MDSFNGFLNINKTIGPTSFDVVRDVRRLANQKKVGHGGSLDPLASGVLVVGLGRALKFIDYVIASSKSYEAEVTLGANTLTYDSETEAELVKSTKPPTEDQLAAALKKFEGEIEQIPPAYSAIKVEGKRAYELSRQGKEVNLKPRKVVVEKIKLLSYRWPEVKVEIDCGRGFYVRSFAKDLGDVLGTGGFLSSLVRTKVGSFELKNSQKIEDISPERLVSTLLSIGEVFKDWPPYELNRVEAGQLKRGQPIPNRGKIKKITAAFNPDREFIGLIKPDQMGLLLISEKLA